MAAEGGPSPGGVIRKPTLAEVQGIKRLIDDTVVQDGAMLSRTLIELCENIRDFQVYVDEDGVGGCCALHVEMADLAEIRSLAVRRELRARGLGVRLLRACLNEAAELGLPRVYALTRAPEFFGKQGFREVEMHELPHKVFRDCVRCALFPECDEVAMVLDLPASG